MGGEVAGSGLPLVVMSHGTGGSFEGHYDTALALAEAAFVVAAVTNTGDSYRDQSGFTQVKKRAAPHQGADRLRARIMAFLNAKLRR